MKSITTTALLVILCIGASHCVNWSNITAPELNNLPPSDFETITADELASIPSEACQGFTSSQVGNLSASAASGLNHTCLAQFPGSACWGFNESFIGAMDPQAFAGWTLNCTTYLSYTAFANVKVEQWAMINSSACNGFGFYTVRNFNSTSGGGVSADCVAQLNTHGTQGTWYSGCSALQDGFVSSLQPSAFSGFLPLCISQTSTYTFSQITSEQLSFVPDSSCNGFSSVNVGSFPSSAGSGLRVGCLANFTAYGCDGLKGPFVGQMTPSTFEGFKSECIAGARAQLFANINSTQMSHIPPLSFQGLYKEQVGSISDDAWTGVSKSQLFYLTNNSFSGLTPSALKTIVNLYTTDVVNIFTVDQTLAYPLKSASEFKSFIPSEVPLMTSWSEVSKDLSTATWLKIALLEKKSDDQTEGPVFDQQTLVALPFSALLGLRVDHVPLIAAMDFKLFNVSHMQYFTNDTVSAMSADQLREITPEAFGAISPFGLSGLNPQVVSSITGEQVQYLSDNQLKGLNCAQLQAFSANQLSLFNSNQTKAYNSAYWTQCRIVAPPFSPIEAPTTTPESSAPVTGDTPTNTPVDNTPSDNTPIDNTPQEIRAPSDNTQGPTSAPVSDSEPLNGVKIFFIILAVALSVAIIGGAIFFYVRKRRADPERQPLFQM